MSANVGTAVSILADVFGYAEFRPGQSDVVERILNGRNVLCVMPTGAGKSLCYQIPALMCERLAVVVSPLVALMDDQVAALKANGVNAAAIHSGRSREDNVDDWRKVAAGKVPILYMSPERLMTDRMLNALDQLCVGLFVIDEAHCISKWGASFRPEYEALSALSDRFPEATIGAFTATADTATQNDISQKLFRGRGDIIVHGFDRPNLQLCVTPKQRWKAQLIEFLDQRRGESGIVYCLSRRATEETAQLLESEGHTALPYHAGMEPDARKRNQDSFMTDSGIVMVATIAFGMGIDKPDIRYVFHANLPSSVEAYYQEIGRAGRDGAPAEVHMLYGFDDIRMRRQFIQQDTAEDDHKRRELKRLDALLTYCEASQCRRQTLLEYFGETTEPCGNCDTCLNPPVLKDGTALARFLCETVMATGNRFGAAHIIDVLRGGETQKIAEQNHDTLSVYGAGKTYPREYWQSFLRQAVAGGLLTIDIEGFGALRLSQAGKEVLAGDREFQYREPLESKAKNKKPKSNARTKHETTLDPAGAKLLTALKELRRDLARERNVPAYVIFPDAALLDMVHLKPTNLDQMAMVNGVGPKKLADFGEMFIAAIQNNRRVDRVGGDGGR